MMVVQGSVVEVCVTSAYTAIPTTGPFTVDFTWLVELIFIICYSCRYVYCVSIDYHAVQ